MKTMLKISIGLNLVLAGGLILTLRQTRVADPSPQAVVETRPTMIVPVASAMQNPAQTEPKPFRWSQLLATKDYHFFVKNLRAVGCPEATVRAIVTADVHAASQARIIALEKEISDFAASPWTNQLTNARKETALKTELRLIPDAEALEIQDLLGLKPAPAETVAALASTSQPISGFDQLQSAQDVAATTGKVAGSDSAAADASAQTLKAIQLPPVPKSAALPLVFQPVDPAAMNLTPSQMEVVNDLRQEFAAMLNGSSQNPEDPAYQQTWQQLQSQNDRMLEANLGQNAFIQYWDAQWDAQHSPVPANQGTTTQ